MYRKNTAGQFICVQLLLTATGAVATGLTPAARRCIDGTFAAGGGTFTEDGTTGSYKYALAQADTNGNNISIIVTATGAMPVCVNFTTTAVDPTAANLGMTNVSANTVQFAGQTVTAAAGVTLPSSVASPTNITAASGVALAAGQKVDVDTIKTNPVVNAGTITFPTNETLASTTNITVATGITVATNSDKTGYVLTAAYDPAKTAAQAGDAMTLTAAYDPAKTAAQAGNAMALTAGERNSLADAILDRDMSTGVDSGSPTVRTVRQALRFLRNKWAVAAGTLTVYKEDDTSSSWTSSVSSTPAADPITGSDPAS